MTNYNPLADSRLFGLAVLLTLPALLFSSMLAAWAPAAAVIGLLLVFGLRGLAGGRFSGHPFLDWPLLLLLLLLPLGLVVTAAPDVSLPRTYAFIANAAFFWAVAAQGETRWLRYSGWVLLAGGLLLSLAFLLGTNFGSHKLTFIDRDLYPLLPGGWRPFWNPVGFNPNLSGGLLALFWPPAVVLIWLGSGWQQRDFAKLVVLVLSLMLLLTQSRGALLGVGLALPVVTLLYDRRWVIFWSVVLVALLAAVYRYGLSPLLESFLRDGALFGDQSLQGRQILWRQAAYLIRDFPLTGVGLGLVEPAVRQLYAPAAFVNSAQEFKHAHNIYLQAGAEMGLLGLAAHVMIYATLFGLLWRRALDPQAGYRQALALGLLGSLVAFLTHGLLEVITYAPRAAVVVWGLFGLMAAVATQPAGSQE